MVNDKDFVLIAGDPSKWDAEIRSLAGNVSLSALQSAQFMDGRRGAILQPVHGGREWVVTHDSSLSGFVAINGMKPVVDKLVAIRVGIAWAERAPLKREFYARRVDVTPEEVEAARRAG
jgi:hypothetical protein